ncbi:hypothetical protein N864_16220 [Intrasporangium chromatireducens Q5-1]|uniref:Putative zinc-finger domain-containing protein n=1 Tax=Intrasporangium chromatireducens Q5-1 TaxID=584657 RepID=W9GDF1_9MICO|nr:zf-HC2 domain-containing protein [Intrasporangium chromatireducens]EWT04080.1 hypothetical protein N864_16220 [Intrasporangium chromatireducens Q5-1]
MTTHRYAEWDAAYVLGALSSADRRDYEDHLAGCAPCRDAVAELAGMPGLLGAVSAVEVLAIDTPEPDDIGPAHLAAVPSTGAVPEPGVPQSVQQGLKQSLRQGSPRFWERGRRWLAVAAALVALGGAGLGGYALSESQQPTRSVVSGPTRLAFSPVSSSTMTAVVDVAPVGDRTSIKVECQYSAYGQDPSSWADYSVWAVGRDGKAGLVTTWRARPDRVMRPSGTAAIPVSQLAAIEIRSVGSGQTVMRAAVG